MQRGGPPGAVHAEPRLDQQSRTAPGRRRSTACSTARGRRRTAAARQRRVRLTDRLRVLAECRRQEPVDGIDRRSGRPGTGRGQQGGDLGGCRCTQPTRTPSGPRASGGRCRGRSGRRRSPAAGPPARSGPARRPRSAGRPASPPGSAAARPAAPATVRRCRGRDRTRTAAGGARPTPRTSGCTGSGRRSGRRRPRAAAGPGRRRAGGAAGWPGPRHPPKAPVSAVNGGASPSQRKPAFGSAPASSSSRAHSRLDRSGGASGIRLKQRYSRGGHWCGPPSARAAAGSAARNRARSDTDPVAAAVKMFAPASSGCSSSRAAAWAGRTRASAP